MKLKLKSKSFDYWTNYYRAASRSDHVFDSDDLMYNNSGESRSKRCAISKRVLACDKNTNSFGDDDCKVTTESKSPDICQHATKVDASHDHGEIDFIFDEEIETLVDEIQEHSEWFGEVSRIKDILLNPIDLSDSTIFESLRRLQFMDFTSFLLKVTEIGEAVNCLQQQTKHRSKEISQLAQILIDGWKQIADEPIAVSACGSEGTQESVNPSFVDDDEEGLPTPPMDEGDFFAIQTFSTDLSLLDDVKFFDGMDDDNGNPQQSGELIKNQEDHRRPCLNSQNIAKSKSPAPDEAKIVPKDSECRRKKEKHAVVRLNKSVTAADSSLGSSPKQTVQPKCRFDRNTLRKISKGVVPKSPQVDQDDKFKPLDDAAIEVKLEASKRKLREGYEQAENAKRQRRIHAIDLPKPKPGARHQKPLIKSRNHIKQQKGHIDPKIPEDVIPKSPQFLQIDKLKQLDEAAINEKLEASSRKIQEGYQQAENAKRQRGAQAIDFCDLPKPGGRYQKPLIKSRNHLKQQKGHTDPKILKDVIPKNPQFIQIDKLKQLDEATINVKLEASRKRLQEGYQQAENVKRQRRVCMIDARDLPKPVAEHPKFRYQKKQQNPICLCF